jgi:predicted RND superfamily exporter protein
LNNDKKKHCTFKPVIKDYKGNYFENNPLKDDKLYNNEIKKMEKVREEKGYTNKEIVKRMAFDIEPKSNKEEISKRVIPNKREKMIENSKKEVENYLQDNKNILKIQLKLGNNKTEFFEINKDEDYIKIVDSFCNNHELNDEKRNKIIRIIKDELKKQ